MTREKLPKHREGLTHSFTILTAAEPDRVKLNLSADDRDELVELLVDSADKAPVPIDLLRRWASRLQKAPVTGDVEEHKGYMTLGFYPDGRVGELFVKMDRQGSRVSGFVDAWAVAMSLLLQYGMPIEDLCNKFKGMRFNPAGLVKGRPFNEAAKSPVDYVCRYILDWVKEGKECE